MEKEAPLPPRITVGFVSLGCAKNLVDSQLMAGNLVAEKIGLAPSPDGADVVIVNTCSFIGDARDESRDEILRALELKAAGRCRAVAVAGCLPQRYRDTIQQEFPDVDAFVGLDELNDIAGIVNRLVAGDRGILDVSEFPERLYEPRVPGLVFTKGAYAYLKIAEGCSHRCAFCAIPSIRGDYRSRPIGSIVAEAEAILAQGFGELTVVSQDSTAYGRDLKNGSDLAALLRALDGIGGKFWIRVLYVYPSLITDPLLETMASLDRVCNYIDVPIQHSHPDILRAMNRPSTAGHVDALAERIRRFMPDVALRTTCITGFPGETEEHFAHLLAHVEAAAYDHLGAFAYSPEEGTHGARLPERPDPAVAEERRSRLMLAQQRIVAGKAAALVGTRTEFLLEQPLDRKGRHWIARSMRFAPEVDGVVELSTRKVRRRGEFVEATYLEPDGYDMLAAE